MSGRRERTAVTADRTIERVDPHVKIISDAVVERAKRRGLDALVYAPHFTRLPAIKRTAQQYTDEELLVIPAREIFTGTWDNRKHVLALGLDEPVPDFITLDGAIAELQRQDATVLVPHPEFLTVGLSGTDCRRYRRTIDAVEVYNPKHFPRHNRRARRLANVLDTPTFGSSYAHLPKTVGEVWTTFPDGVSGAAGVIDALATADRRQVCRRTGRRHWRRARTEFLHLGWENSWKKFDRVVLSGMEPTHPSQDVYGGRFDSVTAY